MSKSVINAQRRKWDLEEFEQIAKEKLKLEEFIPTNNNNNNNQPPPLPIPKGTKIISSRDAINIVNQRIGTHTIFDANELNKIKQNSSTNNNNTNTNNKNESLPGFYCSICQVLLKDNISYYDHLNGKSHLKHIGLSKKISHSTIEEIQLKLFQYRKEYWLNQCENQIQWNYIEKLFNAEEQMKFSKQIIMNKNENNNNNNNNKNSESNDSNDSSNIIHMRVYGGHEILPYPPPIDEDLLPPGLGLEESIQDQMEDDKYENNRIPTDSTSIRVKKEKVSSLRSQEEEESILMKTMGFSSFTS